VTASLLIVGRGRMGRLVEALAPDYEFSVAGTVDVDNVGQPESWPEADVAIDFSLAEAVPENFPVLAARGMNIVIGATGWQAQEPRLRAEAEARGIGVVVAPNFAIGVNLFLALTERAAELWRDQPAFGAWLHELHHATKKDAPSGTALALEAAMRGKGYAHPIDVASSRAGSIPGTHTVGFDAAAETITLTHTARDRTVFARGALQAARWLRGRRGWFTMRDVLGV
jgi:4-hydroxy-tetrahydrodipicolinate reductase